jgi:hypothetical protein
MPIVAFLFAQEVPTYANLMLQSIRRHMPGVKCVQLTDETTPLLDGCEAHRRPWDGNAITIWKMEHLASFDEDVIFLDSDIMVQSDLTKIFDWPFDVALTWRDGPIYDAEGNDLTQLMPINTGVMWSRSPFFWREAADFCKANNYAGWYADQIAVAKVSPWFNVLKLHCDNFNYTPKHGDDVSQRLALHFKGQRKGMMVEYARGHGYRTD